MRLLSTDGDIGRPQCGIRDFSFAPHSRVHALVRHLGERDYELSGDLGMSLRTCTVNLKDGWPTCPQALARLTTELHRARHDRIALLKIIHGYGSSGEGGAIRDAVQAELTRLAQEGQIRAFIPGEDWRISNEATWTALSKHRELKRDRDLGRANRGISIVLL